MDFPDGIRLDDLASWPFDGARVEVGGGCPHWAGGPYGAGDAARADRLLDGWRALVGPDGYGLVLCRPVDEAVWVGRGYGRPG